MDSISSKVMTAAERIREIIASAKGEGFPALFKGARVEKGSQFDLVARLAYLEGLQRALEIIEETEKESNGKRRPS